MDDACREHAARALRLGPACGIHIVEARAERALGLLELGAGRPEVAAAHLRVTGEFALAHGLGSPVLLDWAGDLAEAYVRAGMPERARRALAVLEREAAAPGRPAAPRRRPALPGPAAGRRGRRRRRGRRKNEYPDWGGDEVIPVDQCVRDQLLQSNSRNLQLAEGVDALPAALFPPQVAKNETHRTIKLSVDSTDYVGTFNVVADVNIRAGIRDRLDNKCWEERRCFFGKD